MKKKDLIYNEIKNKIITGEFPAATMLPSESELCDFFQSSREPLRRALKALTSEGYIFPKQGKGYFVNEKEFYIFSTLTSISDLLGRKHREIKVLSFALHSDGLEKGFSNATIFVYERMIKSEDNIIYEKGTIDAELYNNFTLENCRGSILDFLKNNEELPITHSRKTIDCINIDDDHPINGVVDNKVSIAILIKTEVFSEEKLLQTSLQIRENSEIIMSKRY